MKVHLHAEKLRKNMTLRVFNNEKSYMNTESAASLSSIKISL